MNLCFYNKSTCDVEELELALTLADVANWPGKMSRTGHRRPDFRPIQITVMQLASILPLNSTTTYKLHQSTQALQTHISRPNGQDKERYVNYIPL